MFSVPKGVKEIECFLVGGGGKGVHGGGGGGYTKTEKYEISSDIISIVIGSSTGNTSIDDIIAYAGKNAYENGGDGGSGGGSKGVEIGNGNNGGSDGSNGVGSKYAFIGGKGQGTTTRAFGEVDGTLYAGGGGSSAYFANNEGGYGGAGGAGGGGNGFTWFSNAKIQAKSGETNTGGGGGGCISAQGDKPGSGGSGIAIIRWGY